MEDRRARIVVVCFALVALAACGARSGLDELLDGELSEDGGAATIVDASSVVSPDGGRVLDASSLPSDSSTGDARIADATLPLLCAPRSASGSVLSATHLGQTIPSPQGFYELAGMASDAQGNLVLAGSFTGVLDFGGGATITSAPTHYPNLPNNDLPYSEDVFVAKLDPNGNVVFAKSYGTGTAQYARGVALDPAGNIYLVGDFQYAIDFGGPSGSLTTGAPLSTAPEPTNVFVAALDPLGNALWAKSYGNSKTTSNSGAIAVDAHGNVFASGYFSGTIQFAPKGPTLTAVGVFDPRDTNGGQLGGDAFLLGLSSQGDYRFARSFGRAGSSQLVESLAIDPSGAVILGGTFQGTLDLSGQGSGPGLLASPSCAPGYYAYDGFIAKMDTNGVFVWGQALDGDDVSFVTNVAIDPTGGIVVTGNFNGDLAIVGAAGTVPNDAALMPARDEAGVACIGELLGKPWSVFVAKLDANGTSQWAYALDEASNLGAEDPTPVVVDDTGAIFVAGGVHNGGGFPLADGGTLALDSGLDSWDGFLARLDPNGNAVWAHDFGVSGSSSWPQAVALGACPGDLYFGGDFAGGIAFPIADGGGDVVFDGGWASTNVPTWQMFLARVAR